MKRVVWFQKGMIGVIFLAVVWFYAWTAFPVGHVFRVSPTSSSYYNLLIDGFRKGKVALDLPVPPELIALKDPYDPAQNTSYRLHDASYYRGRYQIYFGVTPAILLFLPFRLLTGEYLGTDQAVLFFCCLGFGASVWLVILVRRILFPELAFGFALFGACAMGLLTMVPALLRRPDIWEIPIAAAFAFFILAVVGVFKALTGARSKDRISWLSLASCAYGFAIGARPTYAFGAIILLAPLWAKLKHENKVSPMVDKPSVTALVFAAVLPLGLIVCGLLAYNYVRFDNPLEFGQNYQMSGANERQLIHFSPRYLWFNAKVYLFSFARFSAYFPFFKIIQSPVAPPGQFGIEDPYGILPNIPFTLMAAATLLVQKRSMLANVLTSIASATLGVGLVVFFFGGACSRYMVDFLPGILLLAIMGVFICETSLKHSSALLARAIWIPLFIWSLSFNVLVSIGHNELLKTSYPEVYRPLSRMGNMPGAFLDKLRNVRYGPLEITVKLPKGKTRELQPIVITGMSFLSDYVYFYYPTDTEVVLGYEHAGAGGPASRPIKVDYNATHVVKIEMGSLYPPEGHSYFDGLDNYQRAERANLLKVSLDGVTCLETYGSFYDAISANPLFRVIEERDAFGKKFSGEIIQTARLDPEFIPLESAQEGPVKIALKFPLNRIRSSEPLVCSGVTGKGDLLYITYLDDHHVRYTLDHWGVGGPTSDPVEVDYSAVQVLYINLGSLYRDGETDRIGAGKRLTIIQNGHPVFDAPCSFYHEGFRNIAIGDNRIRASNADPVFTGKIIVAHKVTPLEFTGLRKSGF